MSSTLPRPGHSPPLEPFPMTREHLPVGFGMTSLVLGTIALILTFLPVLGIPISALGLLFGLIGAVLAWRGGGVRLRWGLMGIGASSFALAVNIAIAFSPWGYLPIDREVPKLWQQPPDRPYVPPPEPENFGPPG